MNTQNLLEKLRQIVGAKYVMTDPGQTERYRTGYRFGIGNALAVVRPATLGEQWQVLEACTEADVIVISQAANTGITGGSNPFGNDYDRDVVIINTMRNDNIQLILDGTQAVPTWFYPEPFGGRTQALRTWTTLSDWLLLYWCFCDWRGV